MDVSFTIGETKKFYTYGMDTYVLGVYKLVKIFQRSGYLSSKHGRRAVPYLLVFPAILAVAGVLGLSVLYGIGLSFFDYSLMVDTISFVGLKNYIDLFLSPRFINSLKASIIFVFGSVCIAFFMSLIFSLSLYRAKFFSNMLKALSLIPYLIAGVAAAVMFRFMFAGDAGLINAIFQMLGMERILFLAQPQWALFVVILANVWRNIPFSTLILLAGLQSVDDDLYEAARVDGSSRLNTFFKITLPLILPMMGIAVVYLSFVSFNMFDVVLPLTGGGPRRATELLALYMYNVSFSEYRFSMGSTVMMVILTFNILTSVIFLRIFRSKE